MPNKRVLVIALTLFLSLGLQTATAPTASGQQPAPNPDSEAAASRASVVTTMRQMADWQIGALGGSQNESWTTATFFDGLMALYQTTGDSTYLNRAVSWGTANNWTPASDQFNPDNQNAGQSFLEMYLLQPSANRLTPTQKVMDGVIARGGPGRQVWWWADSLFMAPPTFARLGGVTGSGHYFDFMSNWYWDASNHLLDPNAELFWRDASFFGKTCPNGQKMFWSRGNAWVMGGIVRVLEVLPANHPSRPQFIALLRNMSAAVARLQRADGYWSSCLTDAKDYPEPETSGTAGFVYAMAWGVNNGVLDAATYTPVVQNGWNALVNAVQQPSGALGWVQPTGTQPAHSSAGDHGTYGTGLALLAGSEVAKMNLGPSFVLSAAPNSQTINTGAGTSYTITVTPSGGFSGNVGFSVSGLPSGATGSFNPPSVSGSGSSALNISTSAATPAGSHSLTITGTSTSPSLTNTAVVTLAINGPGECQTATSSGAFQNSSFASQTDAFTAQFDATPSVSPINTTMGLSRGVAGAYTDLAAIVRFNPNGNIDARNGGAFAAAATIPYQAGVTYHFRLTVNIPAHTYSAFVTPAGGMEQTVGSNFAFRTEQNAVKTLSNLGFRLGTTPAGSTTVCNISVF
ncbi:MAG TPA: glycoside hydrolase family 88 protein [Terriglobales bacterium]|nr:glycoside hydrolase family 88 protein [Terriglobales bacterium]